MVHDMVHDYARVVRLTLIGTQSVLESSNYNYLLIRNHYFNQLILLKRGRGLATRSAGTAIPASSALKRNARATPIEDTVMRVRISNKLEMWCKTCIGKHPVGVAAYREHFARLDLMVPIEAPCICVGVNRALVDDRLPVIFAQVIETLELE